jgi:N-acetylmuramoyl-L-alanine amidase
MRSFGSVLPAALLLAGLAAALHAQSRGPAAEYADAVARETALREELDAPVPAAATGLLRRMRAMTSSYEALARTHPTSGYGDNALWQAGMLAADAFWHFGHAEDREAARRLLRSLNARFPTSSLVRRIPEQLTRLEHAPGPAPRRASSTPTAGTSRTSAIVTGGRESSQPSTLTGIRREALPDVLRITLQLAHEIPFVGERLDDPPRLYVDLHNTRVLYDLKDSDLAFGDDVVRQIRVGSHEGDRTRVVFDLDGAGRASIYPLYNPYRLVIDLQRARVRPPAAPARASGPAAPAAATAAPAEPAEVNADGGFSLSRQLGLGVARIVIDPGHGGHDPGARVSGLTEAALVLDVALRLEARLRTEASVEVVLTRRTDEFLALEKRTELANRVDADLFLSIHANASTNSGARGIETYFLNFAADAAAEAIAARENAGSLRTMRDLNDIVRKIALNDKVDESRDFATQVQGRLYERLRAVNTGTKNLGVKQAPFQVLIGATMPSVLAEISFLTHRDEGRLLETDAYRQEIAEALYEGVMAYQRSLKRPAVASQ